MRWSIRSVAALLLMVLMAMFMVACGGDDEEPAASGNGSGEAVSDGDAAASDVEPSITIGVASPNYATQMGIYVAKDKGYLEEEGITDVEVITSEEYVPGLIGGSLDIALGDSVAWFNAAQKSGEPVEYLAAWWQAGDQILAAGPKSGIKTPEDLVGKKVTAGDRGGQDEFVLRTILEKIDIDPEDVEIVPFGGRSDARFQALINGQVDAATIFGRHRGPLDNEGGVILYDDPVESPQEGYAVMKSTLDEKGPTIEAFLAAEIKARQFILDPANKDEVLQIMQDNDFEITELETDAFDGYLPMVSPDGGFDPKAMDDLIDLQKATGLAEESLEWRDYVNLDPLHNAQETNGLDPRPASVD